MSPSDDNDEGYDSSCVSSSDDDGAPRHLQSQSSVEEENYDDAGSQVMFGMMDLTETYFLMPGKQYFYAQLAPIALIGRPREFRAAPLAPAWRGVV